VNRINSIELFDAPEDEEGKLDPEITQQECIKTPETEFKVVNSILKFAHMIFDWLKLIRGFPSIAYDASIRLVDFIKVRTSFSIGVSSTTPTPAN